MTIWFTSDTHFWHRNVIGYCGRPFPTVELMNEKLIDNWNERVSMLDTVFVLGDFAFCGATEIKNILKRLNGKKHLVMGNHDWKYRAERWLEFGFTSVRSDGVLPSDRSILMSHFPYKGSGDHIAGQERYSESRPEDKGCWLLHGHVHNAWKRKDRMINVGVDVWDYKPVSIDEIKKEIA